MIKNRMDGTQQATIPIWSILNLYLIKQNGKELYSENWKKCVFPKLLGEKLIID